MLFLLGLLGTNHLDAQCDADAGNNVTICSGQSTQIGGNPTAIDPNNAANVTYSWVIGNGTPFSTNSNPTVNPTTTTTYTVDLSGGGCGGESDQVVVTVIPAAFGITANANGGPNAITICAGSSLDLSSTVTSAPAGVTYDWDGPNSYNNSSANPNAFNAGPNSGGTYTVTASIGDCVVSDNISIDVIYPSLSSNQLQDFQGQEYLVKCVTGAAGGNISISDATPPNFDASISSYTINWGDGSPVSTSNDDNWASLIHYYLNGLYTLTLTATGPSNCPATHTYQVFVGSEPAVSLGTPGNTSGCAPRTLTFPVTLTENNIQGTTYVIDFGDGSPTQSFNHPPPASVTHTFTQSSCGETFGSNANAFGVTLVATNPCGNSEATVAPIRISTPPTAGFTANPETICVNQVSTMTSTANPGSTATASSCSSSAIMYWVIAPAAGWTASGLGSSNSFGVTDYDLWTAGSATLPVTFSVPGTYTVTQTIANGCGGDDEQITICVIPPPTCAFILTPTSGCSVLNVTSNNTSQPPSCNGVPLALQYNWTVSPPVGGTGSHTVSSPTAQSPTFSFTNSGTTNITFTVTLTVAPINPQTGLAMSCTTTCTQTVTVFPSPNLASPPVPQVSCGSFDPSPFTLSYTGGPANPQFQWYSTTNPNNPGTPGNPGTAISNATTATYDPPTISVTTYYFCVITYTGVPNCSSYQSGLFQAIVNPIPTVNAGANQTICSTSSAALSATGSGGIAPLTYSWSPVTGLSDPSIANPTASPSVSTTYDVTVTDANGCTATDAVIITVNTAATADVTGTYSFCGAQTFSLNGTANNAGQWTASPGTFSNPTSITSSYTPSASQVGTTFTLTWTTTDPDGSGPCTAATDQATVTINTSGTSNPTTPITICSGSTASLQVTTTPATGSWSGGSGSFANTASSTTVYTPGPSDVGNASLVLVWTTSDPDGNGPCAALIVNQPLSVIGTASADAVGPYAICGATPLTLGAIANGNGQWTGGAGTYSDATLVNATYTPAASEVGTTLNLTWTTNDPDGAGPCNSATDQATVTISTPASFTPLTPITICSSSTASLQVSSSPATGSWSGGSGSFGSASSATTIYTPGAGDASNPNLELIWTTSDPDGNGPCPSITVTQPLNVIGTATAEASGPYSVCGSTAIALAASANGAGQWTGGAGTFSNTTSVNSTYTPAAAEVGTIVNLTWTTNDPDGAGPCTSATDQATVTISTPASFTPLTPLTICSSSTASLQVSTIPATGSWSGGSGSFGNATSSTTVYTPGPGDVTNANLILVWTTTDPDGVTGPCTSITVDQPLDVIGTSTADAGGPYEICGAEPITLSAIANGGGQWTGGVGAYQDATNVGTTYTPAASEVGSTVNLTWTTNDPDGAGPCTSATDQATVTISTPASFTPLTPLTICSSSTASLQVSTIPATGSWSGGSGSFGNATSSTTVYTPGAADVTNANLILVWTTTDPDGVTGPCTSITVDQPLDVIGTSTADAGGPYEICGAEPITLSAIANGGGQWTGGVGAYQDATNVGTTYTPAASEVGSTVNLIWTTNDPDGAGPCTSATDQATVTISTPASFTPLTPLTICSSSTASLLVSTIPATGSWSGGSGSFGNGTSSTTVYTPGPGDVTNANLILVWTTTDPDGVTGPCTSITVDQPLDVIGTSTADAGGPYEICGAEPITLSAIANGGGQWTGGVGAYQDATNVGTTYTPALSEVGSSVTITWTTFDPDGSGPCAAAIDVAVADISTPAVIDAFTPLTICSNDVAQLVAVSTPAAGSWSTSNGTGTFSSAQSPQATYSPGINEVGTVQLVWTTVDPDGTNSPCVPISQTLTLDILQTSVSNISSTYSVCANGTLDINVQENGDGQWTVDPPIAGTFADSSMSTTQFIPSVNYYTAQTLEIKWVTFDPDGTGPCLSAMDSTTVSTLPLPQITMAPSFSIPCGDDISATVSTYQNVPYTFSWTPEAGLIEPDQLTTPAVGDDDYALQVIDANGCVNADTTTVDAIALANMASAANASTCLYVPIQLSGSAADGQGPFTYNWVATEEVTPSVLDNTLADFVFDDYILQDSILNIEFEVSDLYGCTDDTIISVTVFALPAIDPGQNWGLCEDSPVFTLTNFSPQPNTGISGAWTPTDLIDPALIGVNAITYTYTFTDNNGCVNDSSMLVSINEVPQPIMVIPSVACVETPLPLENNTTCGTCSNVEYEWDFGIPNSTSNAFEPSFVYSVNDIGLTTVQLVAMSGFGCDDTTTAVVDIVLPPVPLFEATYNQPSCAPLAVDISHNTDTTGLYLSYEWTIEDITENNIVGVYNTFLPPPIVLQQGDSILDYNITLMVSNVCGQYYTDTIVSVLPQPVADILTSTVYGCTPLVVDFINGSVGLPEAIEWDFGDGTFSGMDTPPPHTFYTDSTITIYNLVVALENECGVDTFFQDITVLPNTVNALFVTSTAAGCTPLEVTFNDFSTGASQLNFTLCNGVTFSGESFTFTFTEPGDCVVELVADNGCSYDTTSVSIFVVQSPEPVIVADDSYCANEPVEFSANNALGAMLTWNFDDGSPQSTGNPVEHAYTDGGDYLVELQAENNLFGVECVGTATHPVHISPNPQAAFSIPTDIGCSPFNLCFTNLSSTSDPNQSLSQQWNFDGVNVGTSFSPCYTYQNQTGELVYYTVTLEVTAADIQYMQTCTSSTSQNILVLPQPISDFEMADPYTCYFPYELATTSTTAGGGAYQWIFNGQNWTQQTNTTFPINDLGAYDIDLIATNQYGCTDTSQQVFNSYPLPTLDFTFDLNDGCDPLMVQFDNLSTGNNTYTWLFDDGTQATIEDIVHEYTNPGSYDVMLVGTTENNCTDTLTIEDPILVYPVPVANFIFAPAEVNILDPQMTFEETGFGGSYFQWDFNDGSEEYGAIVTHSFSEAYYHAVTLTAYNQYGCTDDITKNVFVTDYLTVYVPSAFTPDDDNINDIFRPEMGGKELIARYKFWITDRWGNVIFETNDYNTPWTGNVRGGEHYASPDIYIWSVEAELKNGEEREYNGHVTLVR